MKTITIETVRSDGRHNGYADVAARVSRGIAVHRSARGGWSVTHTATRREIYAGLSWPAALAVAAKARRWPAWVRHATDLHAVRAWGQHEGAPARRACETATAA